MKRKLHHFCLLLALHCVVSFVILGGVRVWQKGYNRTHQEQLQMVNVAVHDQQAEIKILGRNMALSLEWLNENSMLYYGLYAVSDEFIRSWIVICHEIITEFS